MNPNTKSFSPMLRSTASDKNQFLNRKKRNTQECLDKNGQGLAIRSISKAHLRSEEAEPRAELMCIERRGGELTWGGVLQLQHKHTYSRSPQGKPLCV